ncbi:MAG: nitroreductase [Leifsonia sp.]
MASAFEAALRRRSWSRVGDDAPDHAELLRLVGAAGRVADHGSLTPWRVIELRGSARDRLGRALAKSARRHGKDGDGLLTKPLRAPLLIAIVARRRPSDSVPGWEQDAVASGVAHLLSLLLDEAGWGVIWRTGPYTRTKAVRKMHGLRSGERLLGWLYVGGVPADARAGRTKTINAAKFLTTLD